MNAGNAAVFLSYATEDTAVAHRIAEDLKSAGLEVWFDKSELRGGDAWDQSIRRQIRECALFIALISPRTALRHEGYFRLEWDLADERSHMIARNRPFIVPVCLDGEPSAFADVPDSFHRVQWTRLKSAAPSTDLVARIAQLVGQAPEQRSAGSLPTTPREEPRGRRHDRHRTPAWTLAAVIILVAGGTLIAWRARVHASLPGVGQAASVALNKSLAVLPFLDLSEKKDQSYLADGIADQVLNGLARVPELRVIGRSSSFQFRDQADDLRLIHERLGVGYVVTGSVLKNLERVRVNVQLLDADAGMRLWAESFDRGYGDVFELQDQIASGIARALQIAVRAPASSTRNQEAYTAYLRGLWATDRLHQASLFEAQSNFERALTLDPSFARAAEALAQVHVAQAIDEAVEPKGAYEKARAAAQQALRIDSGSAAAHGVLGLTHATLDFDWRAAEMEFAQSRALSSSDATTLRYAAIVAQAQGHHEEALRLVFLSIAQDPLDPYSMSTLGQMLYSAGDFDRAIPAFRKALEINRGYDGDHYYIGVMLLLRNQLEAARQDIDSEVAENAHDGALSMLYHAQGRHADSDDAVRRLERSSAGRWPYGITQAHAFRHDRDETLKWLERAYELRDPDLLISQGDPLLESIHDDPRYQAILRKMNLPN